MTSPYETPTTPSIQHRPLHLPHDHNQELSPENNEEASTALTNSTPAHPHMREKQNPDMEHTPSQTGPPHIPGQTKPVNHASHLLTPRATEHENGPPLAQSRRPEEVVKIYRSHGDGSTPPPDRWASSARQAHTASRRAPRHTAACPVSRSALESRSYRSVACSRSCSVVAFPLASHRDGSQAPWRRAVSSSVNVVSASLRHLTACVSKPGVARRPRNRQACTSTGPSPSSTTPRQRDSVTPAPSTRGRPSPYSDRRGLPTAHSCSRGTAGQGNPRMCARGRVSEPPTRPRSGPSGSRHPVRRRAQEPPREPRSRGRLFR